MTLPLLSVLDLSTVGDGQTSADALAATTESARLADQLGYRRFWVAEHHNFPSVASTTPPVLIAHLAANTSTISVGSGGVMLPNHPPLVVAEQFAMLEALYPGRIDLGIGRAPGTDGRTAVALRRSLVHEGTEEFPKHLLDVMALLGDARHDDNMGTMFSATPVALTSPNVMLLGSSTFSAELAGRLGLPFAFAQHFSGEYLDAAVATYRSAFRPSSVLDLPYLIVATAALAADTEEEAHRQSMPGRLMTVNIRRNRPVPISTVEAALASADAELAISLTQDRVAGTVDTVVAALHDLTERTGADELMIATITHGLDARQRSMRLIANAWSMAQVS